MGWWTSLGATIERFLAQYGLWAAVLLVAVEEAGVPSPIPADLLVLLFGVQARAGGAPLWQVVLLLEGATIVGASALYALARLAGRDVVYYYGRYIGLTKARLDRVEVRLGRAGIWTVAGARLTPGVRVAVALACGVFAVPYRVFLPGMALGALAYLTVFALLGYALGPSVSSVLENVHLPVSSLLSMALLGVALLWLRRARRGAREEAPRRGEMGRLIDRRDQSGDGAREEPPRRAAIGRTRAGLLAGSAAGVCSALALNALTGVAGAVASVVTLPVLQEAQAQLVADQRRLIPLVVGALVAVLIGAVWGAIYAWWGEPLLRRVIRSSDALRGLAFALAPWVLVAALVALLAEVDAVGIVVVAVVQASQQAVYGAVLGLTYPLMRARLVERRRRPREASAPEPNQPAGAALP